MFQMFFRSLQVLQIMIDIMAAVLVALPQGGLMWFTVDKQFCIYVMGVCLSTVTIIPELSPKTQTMAYKAWREYWHLDGNLIRTNRDCCQYSHNLAQLLPRAIVYTTWWLIDLHSTLWEKQILNHIMLVCLGLTSVNPKHNLISVFSEDTVVAGSVWDIFRLLNNGCPNLPFTFSTILGHSNMMYPCLLQ